MKRVSNEKIVNNGGKKNPPSGIFFHDENLTTAGKIIQDAIKERTNH